MPGSLAVYLSLGMGAWIVMDWLTGYTRELAEQIGFQDRDAYVLITLEVIVYATFWPIIFAYYLLELIASPVGR